MSQSSVNKTLNKQQPWPVAALGIIAVIAISLAGDPFSLLQWSQWSIFCILAISFVWVWGHGGIFSFAQVAFFGVGAYAYGIFAINISPITGETFSAIIFGALVAVLLAAILGYFLFYGRVADIYVAIATLAVSLVFGTLMTGTADPKFRVGDALLGGYNGMTGIPSLALSIPGIDWSWDIMGEDLFTVISILAVIVGLVTALIRKSSFGRVVGAIRENENRAFLLGINVPFYQVCTFAISAAIAGLAGGLFAAWGNFIDPTVFDLQMATLLVVWVFVGGKSSIIGAYVGVLLIQQISNSIAITGTILTPLFLGGILILVVLVVPRGIVPTIANLYKKLTNKRAPDNSPDDDLSAYQEMDEKSLPQSVIPSSGVGIEVKNLAISFGGVAAVGGVDVKFPSSGVHCLLGPNGAGKSTLFKLLVGQYIPDKGEISVAGQEISKKSASWRARYGMSIKSQVLSLFPKLSISENLWVAAYAKSGDAKSANEITADLLNWLGYTAETAAMDADSISHGKQQWLDIAMALSQKPQVLLLDEPTAGMGRDETSLVAKVACQIAKNIPVVVVEHDMDFVRQLDAPLVVLHQGLILAKGTLAEIRQNQEVLNVYLGRS